MIFLKLYRGREKAATASYLYIKVEWPYLDYSKNE